MSGVYFLDKVFIVFLFLGTQIAGGHIAAVQRGGAELLSWTLSLQREVLCPNGGHNTTAALWQSSVNRVCI